MGVLLKHVDQKKSHHPNKTENENLTIVLAMQISSTMNKIEHPSDT